MKKILCYGDSNTFGYNPIDGSRYDNKTRWTSLLQNNLGTEYKIMEEGACDRTGFVDNDKGFLFSAQKHFPTIITKTKDIDILILSIGTNDLQFKYNITFNQIENGLEKLIVLAKSYVEHIILIPPVILSENILEGYFNYQFNETSISKSKQVGEMYKKLSKIHKTELFDFNDFVQPSPTDGLHYDIKGHKIIADKLMEFILKNSL